MTCSVKKLEKNILLRLSVKQGTAKVWSPGFNVKIVLLLRETGCVSSGNLQAFEIIGSKAREIVGDATGYMTGDARLLILLSMEMR